MVAPSLSYHAPGDGGGHNPLAPQASHPAAPLLSRSHLQGPVPRTFSPARCPLSAPMHMWAKHNPLLEAGTASLATRRAPGWLPSPLPHTRPPFPCCPLPAFPRSPLLSDADLLPLLAANPGLRYLNLSCAGPAVTDAALLGAARSCPRLEALDVCHADGMTEEGAGSWGVRRA